MFPMIHYGMQTLGGGVRGRLCLKPACAIQTYNIRSVILLLCVEEFPIRNERKNKIIKVEKIQKAMDSKEARNETVKKKVFTLTRHMHVECRRGAGCPEMGSIRSGSA